MNRIGFQVMNSKFLNENSLTARLTLIVALTGVLWNRRGLTISICSEMQKTLVAQQFVRKCSSYPTPLFNLSQLNEADIIRKARHH